MTSLSQPRWSFPTFGGQELPAGTDGSGVLPWDGPLVSVGPRSQFVTKPRWRFSPVRHCGQCPHRCGWDATRLLGPLCNPPAGDPKSYAYGFTCDIRGPYHALYMGAAALLAARESGSARLDLPARRPRALSTYGSLKGQRLPCYSD